MTHKMNFLYLLCLLAPLFAVLAAAAPSNSVTLADVKPPAGTVKISSVSVDAPDVDTDGSGCRSGSVGAGFASDNSIMTLIFDDFAAAIGPGAGNVKKRALCRVNVTMTSPGWAFDVQSVDFRGYVKLAKGVDVSIVSRWKWVDIQSGLDLKGKGNIQKKYAGPYEEDFLVHKAGETSDPEPSICQKMSARFQITISASLDAASSIVAGIVRGDSVDAKFGELMNLKWRKC